MRSGHGWLAPPPWRRIFCGCLNKSVELSKWDPIGAGMLWHVSSATSSYHFSSLKTMALSSSAKSRSGGGVTRRRVKSPEGVGAAERAMGKAQVAAGAPALEDEEGMSCTTSAAGGVAAGAGPGAAVAGGARVGEAGPEDGASASHTTSSAEENAAGLPGGAVGLGQSAAAAGASATASGVSGAGVSAAASGVPSRLRLWLARARGLGLTEPQVVFDLHVRQGLPLLAVAQVLGLGLEAVRELWLQSRAARAAQAPQSEPDFTALREHISCALWQTVEATFPDVMADADADEDADPPNAPSPPMLSVRLKALDQIAKLYDITLEQRPAAFAPLPYATPDDIADDVRMRVLEMHRRG